MRNLKLLIKDPKFAIYSLAKSYINRYEGFSYDFVTNGEKNLIDRLSSHEINTVFDVGANIGNWSKIAASCFTGATIHSFEISEVTFRNLKKNNSLKNVICNNFGLSSSSGTITYKDYGENAGVNTIIQEADFHDGRKSFSLKEGSLSTGDEYCRKHGIDTIDFLKIDVEGAEHLVLSGFKQLLSQRKIKVIQFEYGYTHGDSHFLMKDFYKLLAGYGYVLGPLKPSGVLFQDFRYRLNDFNSGPNYVAIPKDEKNLIRLLKGPVIKGY